MTLEARGLVLSSAQRTVAEWSPVGMDRRRRTVPLRTIYSVGYEGCDLAGFLSVLERHNIELLVDVRLTPLSRKRGFSKKALDAALSAHGITYLHAPELGNPKENRAAFSNGQIANGRERYLAHLNNGSRARFDEVVLHASKSRTALLCVEKDDRICHRGCITDLAMAENPSIRVKRIL